MPRLPRPVLSSAPLILALLLAGCASSWAPLDRSTFPSVERYPDAKAVVLEQRNQVTAELINGAPGVIEREYSRMLLLRPEGVEEVFLGQGYSKTFNEVLNIRARLTRPDGSEQHLERGDFDDHPAFGEVLYQDRRVMVHSIEALPAGTVVELEIETRLREAGNFVHAFQFERRIPVERASVEVVLPVGFDARYTVTQAWRDQQWAPEEIRREDGARILRWSAGPLAPIPDEPYRPSDADLARRITVQLTAWPGGEGFKDFEAYGRYLAQLQDGTDGVTPALERQVEEILRGAPDDRHQRAERLYDWVRSNIRYVAVEVGHGGWRPHTAEEVLQWRYGDCKDKANLLRVMLKVAGIESDLAEIYHHSGVPRRLVLPGLGSSNHAILSVSLPGQRLLVDPTAETVPFGALPAGDSEAEVFLIRSRGAQIVTAPSTAPGDNRREVLLQLKLQPDGRGEGLVRGIWTGEYAHRWDQERIELTHDKRDDQLLRWSGVLGAEGSQLRDQPAGASNLRSSELQVRFAAAGVRAGDRLVLRPADLLSPAAPNLPPPPRRTPWVWRNRHQTKRRIEIVPPAGMEATNLPEVITVESRYGRFRGGWVRSEAGFTYEGELELSERVVAPEEYSELKSFFDRVLAGEARPVVVAATTEGAR